jgi:hypothetical protein
MSYSVAFQDEVVEFDLPGESLLGCWSGPAGGTAEAAESALRGALEQPLEYPPLRQLVVPGDRVAIALDSTLTDVRLVLGVVDEILRQAGVVRGGVSVVATPGATAALAEEVPPGIRLFVHDPADARSLAYLATTREGRRIYLNRQITDADVVLPVGRLGFDPLLGYRGPWSVLFPGLSDAATAGWYRQLLEDDPPDRLAPRARLDEPFEVSWLLGTQMHVGLLPGAFGLTEAIAGLAEPAREAGVKALSESWCFQAQERADCVVVGVGLPGRQAGLNDLIDALVTASRLVSQGGRIVALSTARGAIGRSLQRLAAASDLREASAALRGHHSDPDSVAGRRLCRVLDWADVYLLSELDRHVVEDLSMIPLDHPEDARRLASRSGTCLLVSHADLTRAAVSPRRSGKSRNAATARSE